MPAYDYRRSECDKRFEVSRPMGSTEREGVSFVRCDCEARFHASRRRVQRVRFSQHGLQTPSYGRQRIQLPREDRGSVEPLCLLSGSRIAGSIGDS
jgi:hypothetical protein